MSQIIQISDRGTLTLPKKIREQAGTKLFNIEFTPLGTIEMSPVQTREEYMAELDAAEADYDKNGGLTVAEMRAKYDL